MYLVSGYKEAVNAALNDKHVNENAKKWLMDHQLNKYH